MADRCLCHAYFEGVYDKQIKQGQDFDLAQGVRAIDGYGNEVDFTYEPTEIDLCKTGDQEVTYKAFGASFNIVPKLCMPKYKKGVSIPEACSSDLEMITAKRIIRIIRASNPRFLGIPRVFINENDAFDPTEGVTAVDDNGNELDFSYEGKYDLVAEGDGITTFETEYEQNAKAVNVALEPIQDLNGYDKPWSGGAGKNLFNKDDDISSRSYYYNVNGEQIASINYKTSNPIPIRANTSYYWAINGVPALDVGTHNAPRVSYWDANMNWVGSGEVLGRSGSASISPTDAVYALIPVYIYKPETLATAMFVEGTAMPTSYEPYSNICPISGHTEVVTHRTGKNLMPSINATFTDNGVTWALNSDGSVKLDGTATFNSVYDFGRNVLTLPAGAYTTHDYTVSGAYSVTIFKVVNGTASVIKSGGGSFNLTETASVFVRYVVSSGVTVNTTIYPQIELGSTATDYEPYQGTTYTTDLGQTVYGGTLDVVSGELVVDRATKTLNGTESWSIYTTASLNQLYTSISGIMYRANTANVISDKFNSIPIEQREGNYNTVYAYRAGVGFNVEGYSQASWREFLAQNPVQIVYELATPQTYQLTPQQVELLKGTNNVWSDEGDVIVIYEGNIPQDGSFEYPLEGEYTITYTATDKCGNEGTAERTIVVTPSE